MGFVSLEIASLCIISGTNRLNGVQEVGGSNPLGPTRLEGRLSADDSRPFPLTALSLASSVFFRISSVYGGTGVDSNFPRLSAVGATIGPSRQSPSPERLPFRPGCPEGRAPAERRGRLVADGVDQLAIEEQSMTTALPHGLAAEPGKSSANAVPQLVVPSKKTGPVSSAKTGPLGMVSGHTWASARRTDGLDAWFFCELLRLPRCGVKSGARWLQVPASTGIHLSSIGPPPNGLSKLSCCRDRMTSVDQSKLVSEPLAVLDQGLGQW